MLEELFLCFQLPGKQSSPVSVYPEMRAGCVNMASGNVAYHPLQKPARQRKGEKRGRKVYVILLPKQLLYIHFSHSRR